MTNFNEFGLSDRMLTALTQMGFTTPTPVQAQAIPLALDGQDILGSAQTGTGKTGAFSIPLVEKILNNPNDCALILTPTRELAKQVMDVIHQMVGRKSGINTAFIIGGEPYPKQLAQLRQNPRIIVGTPGRINDHIDRKTLKLDHTRFLVLDETDRMLDMGFGVQLERIAAHLPQDRQTLMFSATLPDAIIRLSKKYLQNPARIAVGATNIVAPKIKQEIIRLGQEEKYSTLVEQLKTREGTVIIFVKTKHGTERMAKSLARDGFTADALHGDLRQSRRTRVLESFRNKKFRVLVATDIAARGLDVPHIEHVVNFDLPQVAEDYIHRMGRTARAGADGAALCFISPQDRQKWREIEKLLGIESDEPRRESRNNRNGKKAKFDPSKSRRKFTSGGKTKTDGSSNDNAPAKKSWKPRPAKQGDESRSAGKPSYKGGKPFAKSSRPSKPAHTGAKSKKRA